MAPFLLLGLNSARLAKANQSAAAAVLFLIGVSILGYFYFTGHEAAQRSLLAKRWTAAALSIGFITFKSAALIAVWYAVGTLALRSQREGDS
jgi:hypothetical protein